MYRNFTHFDVFSEESNFVERTRLYEEASIFTAETFAIESAIDLCDQDENGFYLILSDSMSALSAIKNNYSKDQMIKRFM